MRKRLPWEGCGGQSLSLSPSWVVLSLCGPWAEGWRWPTAGGSLWVRQFAIYPPLSRMKTKRVPRGHSLAYLINYCVGICFRQLHIMYNRQFHTASKLNLRPKSHCQSPQRASCHVRRDRVVVVLPFSVLGDRQTLATDRRSQDTRSHKSERHKGSPSAEPDCCNEPTVPNIYYSGTKQP